MYYDPFGLLLGGNGYQYIWGTDDCAGGDADITDYFLNGVHNWWTGNTAVATASNNQISGVGVGSTTNYVSGYMPITREVGYGRPCPNQIQQPSAPVNVMPHIFFSGNDITNATQSVVVGQQIALTTSYTLPSGVTVTGQSWSVAGTTVGGYSPISSSGATIPTNFTQGSTIFYWAVSGNSLSVTFTLNLSNGQTPSAAATFNVSGVTSPSMSIQNYGLLTVDNLTGCDGVTGGPFLVYGNIAGPAPGCLGPNTGTAGITFTPTGTQPSAGAFSFVQIINSDTSTYSRTGNTMTCFRSAPGWMAQSPTLASFPPVSQPMLRVLP